MTGFVVGDDRSQSTLFPERLDDYLGEDNPVWLAKRPRFCTAWVICGHRRARCPVCFNFRSRR
jgi:hypothetical protein